MRRQLTTVLLLLSGLFCLNAQQTCPEIRSDHPRLFFNAQSWPEIEARAKGPARHYLDKLLEQADSYTDNPVCSGTGGTDKKEGRQADGSYYSASTSLQSYIKEFGFQSAQCALAWRFTGEEKYLEKAKKMILANIKGYDEATKNLRFVNWYSTSRILTLCAYDWIYEALTPEERASMIIPLAKHVARVQPDGGPAIPRNSVGWPEGSGFYGVGSLLWYCGVAACGDGFCDDLARSQLEKGYSLYMRLMKWRDSTAGDDGALVSISNNYVILAYPWAHFNFMHTLRSAAGIDISWDYPYISLLPNWLWWNWIRDDSCGGIRTPGIGDTVHSQNVDECPNLYEHLVQYMNFYRDINPDASRLAASLSRYLPQKRLDLNFPIYPFLLEESSAFETLQPSQLEDAPLKARHFETLGQFHMRSGWNEYDTYCTFMAGAVSGMRQHRHYDENSFTIYKHDHLALDTGCRGLQNDLNLKYYYSQSVAHNVVLIHKPDEPLPDHWGQSDESIPQGRTNYGGMYPDLFADVLAFETGKDFSYIASDATKCYKSKCTESVRQFVYVHPDFFIVYDREGAADPSYLKQWLLHSQNEPVIKGRISRFDAGRGRLFCQTLLPEDARIRKEGGEGREFWSNGYNWEMDRWRTIAYEKEALETGRGPYTGAWRIEISPKSGNADDRFLNVLTATDTQTSKPVKAVLVRDGKRDGVTLTLPDNREMTFMFNRYGKVGGTVTIDSQTRELTETVQKQSGVITTY